jgi:hypothetical protein
MSHRAPELEGQLWVDHASSFRRAQMAAFGAFSSLPRVPAKVPSPILCRPPSSRNADRWPVEFTAYALASRLSASWMGRG